ncbi:polysaccharide deacetylase family protein [Mesorhizobium australicum]|uniref:Chitooligosaccharide deacetylase n=1 Tax=Mesorhizobium australicum TaxID=536018 RepID=A0A1X7MUZ2_9HYPH|nr:polysaccharide deacetylase family protein [Mesorhizobium australicum]SMH27763.1 Peptidoglycan/xylan/chitin deacetylase, PgdA/CDA1 family [Mesorhizobium australicum]
MTSMDSSRLTWPVAPWPVSDRPTIRWPNGARVAFWVAPNVEFYEISPPSNPVRAAWPRPAPDILNVTARDYGNRVGVWRCIDIFDRYGIVGSVSLNSAMCRHFPHVVDLFVERGWELLCHGDYNTRYLFGRSREDEKALIKNACAEIAEFGGRPVEGFLAPALTYTEHTFDILTELGISYTLDLFDRDEPYRLSPRYGEMVSVPYQVEINDFHALTAQGLAGEFYLRRFRNHLDRLCLEGEQSGRVVGLPLHPYIIGQPQYVWVLEEMMAYVRQRDDVWIATAGDIARHFRATTAGSRQGATQS